MMSEKRITLNGIKRVGLFNWKTRENWNVRKVHVWSGEHGLFWRAEASGYTSDRTQAGVYEFHDAFDRTKHCGKEKRIEFVEAQS